MPEAIPIQDRLTGSLLALACGDALGAPLEFTAQPEAQRRFGTVTDMIGGGPWAPGEWTDDTAMALCVSEGILACPEDPVNEVGRRFLEWARTAKDVGNTTSAALRGYTGDWAEASKNTSRAKRGEAGTNGSLMRAAPLALAYRSRDVMLRQGARISAMTHWDPRAEVCCAVYLIWVQLLLRGRPIRQAWEKALEIGRISAERGALSPDTPGPSPLPEDFWPRMEKIASLKYEELQPSGYAGDVLECLEAAVGCCLQAESLEQALVKAVNLAGESDTIASVAGGAAGAFWGVSAIPDRWLEQLHQKDRLLRAAAQISALRQERAGYDHPTLKPFEYSQVGPRLFAGRNPLTGEDVDELLDLGVNHYLDLRQPKEHAPPRFGSEAIEVMGERGILRESLPVEDMGAPTLETLEQAVDYLEKTLENPDNVVYVSCRAGIERTAAVLTAYYADRYRVSYEAALTALREGRPCLSPLWGQENAVRRFLKERGAG